MTQKTMKLWVDVRGVDDFEPYMELYPLENTNAGAVLICPGGGYGGRAPHEGADIAKAYNQLGFHAFVVHYRVSPNRHPAPLKDVTRALRLVRQNADQWNVKKDKIAVCGFSAGGHLTGSIGVHYNDPDALNGDELDSVSARPDALILCYAVLTGDEFRHDGSFRNLLGEERTDALMAKMSLENQIDSETPPTFLWHTANDGAVPVENSLLFASALSKNNVPFELHVFPDGRHGLGLAKELPNVAEWINLSATWLKNMEF